MGNKVTANALLSRPPGEGGYLLQTHLKGDLVYLTTRMVSVLHKEKKLECKVEEAQVQRLEVIKPGIKTKSVLPAGE